MSKDVGTFHISEIPNGFWECSECGKRVKYGEETHTHFQPTDSDTLLNLADQIQTLTTKYHHKEISFDDFNTHSVRYQEEALIALTEREERLIREAKIEENVISRDRFKNGSWEYVWFNDRISELTKQPQGKK